MAFEAVRETLKKDRRPALVILDATAFDDRVLERVPELISMHELPDISLLYIVDRKMMGRGLFPIEDGCIDFLMKPYRKMDLNARLEICAGNIQNAVQAKQAITRDPLTTLATRQNFLEHSRPLYASAKRDQATLSLMIISPDNLDRINREYGQLAGDIVLMEMAGLLDKRKRDTDMLCRFAGSRFCLLTLNMDETHLVTYLDDMLALVQSHDYIVGKDVINITASSGATTNIGNDIHDMIFLAEQGLLASREAGQNRFTVYNELQNVSSKAHSVS
ncbi:GGDEF domain-containing protein [Sneathiella aquimaris]|uniref:GGDEF domain-containing protein n=1 Tax=Sneathiella aquimaris TaxID=2599305 RepID=UPI00146AE500|nr:GGDEF domain-containing protein [Sneathiella aquimaris]